MSEPDFAAVGAVARLGDKLEELLKILRKPEEWGGTGDIEILRWDPAAPAGGPALSGELMYDGTFVSIGIFNLSGGVMRVSLTPNGSRDAGRELFTLAARGFIVLPYRGSTVSVSGAAAGSALVVPCDVAQPLNAGTF